MLRISAVVIGKKNLNPGRSMTMSPGRWNRCSFLSHGQRSPAMRSKLPSRTNGRFTAGRFPSSAKGIGGGVPRLSTLVRGRTVAEALVSLPRHHHGARAPAFTDDQLVGDLDDRMFAGRADILACFELLIGESIAFGSAHAFDRRLFVVGGEVARNRASG